MKKYEDVASYIAAHPKPVQALLKAMRAAVKKGAPKAVEALAYGMPGYKLDGPLVYFAAFKKHIGFFPMPSAIAKYETQLRKYKTSRGGIQFPLDEQIPSELVTKITKFRAKENLAKVKKKNAAKKSGRVPSMFSD